MFISVTSGTGRRKLLDINKNTQKNNFDDNFSFNNCLNKASYIDLYNKLQNIPKEPSNLYSKIKYDSDLWAEKYRASIYLDLLSLENINRNILQWFQAWNGKICSIPKTDDLNHGSYNNANHNIDRYKCYNSDSNGKKKYIPHHAPFRHFYTKNDNFHIDFDDNGLPRNKVIIIWGPPGMGKSTLAHIVAKQAGFTPIEVNASEERNEDSFKTVIRDTLATHTIQSLSQLSLKPKCLILDEIDGACISAINYLVRLIQKSSAVKNHGENSDPNSMDYEESEMEKGSHKTKSKTYKEHKNKPKKKDSLDSVLAKRPIICLANDIYTPVLKELRARSLCIHVNGPAEHRLRQRLLMISEMQEMDKSFANEKYINLICNMFDNDIRSCINFLQFEGNTLDEYNDNIFDISQSLKDKTFNINELLRTVYADNCESEFSNQQLHNNAAGENIDKIESALFQTYLSHLTQLGNNPKKVSLVANTPKSLLKKSLMISNYFATHQDSMATYVKRQQNYALYPYLTFLPSAISTIINAENYEMHSKISGKIAKNPNTQDFQNDILDNQNMNNVNDYEINTKKALINEIESTSFYQKCEDQNLNPTSFLKFVSNNDKSSMFYSSKSEFQRNARKTQLLNVCNSILLHCNVQHVRPFVNAEILSLDLIPHVWYIINPTKKVVRQVNYQLLTLEEKNVINQTASIMVDYDLNYVKRNYIDAMSELKDSNSSNLHIEPKILDLLLFYVPDSETKNTTISKSDNSFYDDNYIINDTIKQCEIPYNLKILIQQQINTSKIRKICVDKENRQQNVDKQTYGITKALNNFTKPAQNSNRLAPPKTLTEISKNINGQIPPLEKNRKKRKNTFENYFIKPKISSQINENDEVDSMASKIHKGQNGFERPNIYYVYRDGCTNAVRRNVKIQEFINFDI